MLSVLDGLPEMALLKIVQGELESPDIPDFSESSFDPETQTRLMTLYYQSQAERSSRLAEHYLELRGKHLKNRQLRVTYNSQHEGWKQQADLHRQLSAERLGTLPPITPEDMYGLIKRMVLQIFPDLPPATVALLAKVEK